MDGIQIHIDKRQSQHCDTIFYTVTFCFCLDGRQRQAIGFGRSLRQALKMAWSHYRATVKFGAVHVAHWYGEKQAAAAK